MVDWDPHTYLQFADERSRPFADLVSQVYASSPTRVVDLGCGPGELTASLALHWPAAYVEGIDSSPQMIAQADRQAGERLSFRVADLRDWRPEQPVHVIISNAALQWVPGHRALLPRLIESLVPGGWLAVQVPGNFDAPSHRLLHTLAADPRFAPHLTHLDDPTALDAASYLGDLSAVGCAVNAWETTYLHLLAGPDPVFRWIAGTRARPILQALPADLRLEFEAEYRTLLDRAYPAQAYGTVLPYRRVFVVAQRRGG